MAMILNIIKNISTTEIIVLVLILLVLFGSRVMVGIGRVSGRVVKEIRNIRREFTEAVESVVTRQP